MPPTLASTPLRREQFATAIAALSNGVALEVVGNHGSGRTTFLHQLRAHFEDRAFEVLFINGFRQLLSRPLAALGVADISVTTESRTSGLDAIVSDLFNRLPVDTSLIVVDDGDDLDEMSWGVVAALRARRGIAVAYSRLTRPPSAKTLTSSGLGEVTTVELGPARFNDFSAALEARHDRTIEAGTLSRVYAKSAGNIGLANALLDTGLREGLITDRDGVLAAQSALWSRSLTQTMERVLEPLTTQQRRVLELFAFVGMLDVETAELLSDPDDFEHLEGLTLVKLYPSGDRLLVSVSPPLLVDYFRSDLGAVRRRRLEGTLREALDPGGVASIPAPALPGSDSRAELVYMFNEHQRTRTVVARSAWERSPNIETAAHYIEVLAAGSSASTELDHLFDASVELVDAAARERSQRRARTSWHALRAEHWAYMHGSPAEAVAYLREKAETVGKYAGVLLARAVEIEHELLGAVDIDALPDPDDDDLEFDARIALHRVRAHVCSARGQLDASDRHLSAMREISGEEIDPASSALTALNLALRRRTVEALALAGAGIDESRRQFDPAGMQTYAAVAAFCGMIDGRYGDVEDILDDALSLGAPRARPPYAPFAHQSLTIMSSVVASRRGRRSLAAQIDLELSRLTVPNGPYPGQQTAWAHGQSVASRGDYLGAATLIEDSGNACWARGARLAAALAYNTALELDPTAERLARLAERISSVEGAMVHDNFAHVSAVVAGDVKALLENADRFVSAGNAGLALASLAAAAETATASETPALESEIKSRHQALIESLEIGSYDANRFRTTHVELTARETEVARYAAAGLTNQQIAAELTLSIRTVESHLHRVMRKVGVERRHELRKIVDSNGRIV